MNGKRFCLPILSFLISTTVFGGEFSTFLERLPEMKLLRKMAEECNCVVKISGIESNILHRYYELSEQAIQNPRLFRASFFSNPRIYKILSRRGTFSLETSTSELEALERAVQKSSILKSRSGNSLFNLKKSPTKLDALFLNAGTIQIHPNGKLVETGFSGSISWERKNTVGLTKIEALDHFLDVLEAHSLTYTPFDENEILRLKALVSDSNFADLRQMGLGHLADRIDRIFIASSNIADTQEVFKKSGLTEIFQSQFQTQSKINGETLSHFDEKKFWKLPIEDQKSFSIVSTWLEAGPLQGASFSGYVKENVLNPPTFSTARELGLSVLGHQTKGRGSDLVFHSPFKSPNVIASRGRHSGEHLLPGGETVGVIDSGSVYGTGLYCYPGKEGNIPFGEGERSQINFKLRPNAIEGKDFRIISLTRSEMYRGESVRLDPPEILILTPCVDVVDRPNSVDDSVHDLISKSFNEMDGYRNFERAYEIRMRVALGEVKPDFFKSEIKFITGLARNYMRNNVDAEITDVYRQLLSVLDFSGIGMKDEEDKKLLISQLPKMNNPRVGAELKHGIDLFFSKRCAALLKEVSLR